MMKGLKTLFLPRIIEAIPSGWHFGKCKRSDHAMKTKVGAGGRTSSFFICSSPWRLQDVKVIVVPLNARSDPDVRRLSRSPDCCRSRHTNHSAGTTTVSYSYLEGFHYHPRPSRRVARFKWGPHERLFRLTATSLNQPM
jgi:hypothetical protein